MTSSSSVVHASDRKREETTGNQRELALLGLVPAPKMVGVDLIENCANARQALSLCIRLSGFTDETVAERVGISKGYLSKVLNGRASLDGDKRMRLMRVCGNLAPTQYEAKAMGCELALIDSRAAEVAALRARLKELEQAA